MHCTLNIIIFPTLVAHAAFVSQNRHSIIKKVLPNVDYRSRSLLSMSWGPEPIWTNAKILETKPVSSNSVNLAVEVSEDVSKEFKVPGQYLQVRENEDGKPLFLAVASPPSSDDAENSNILEFLIKETDSNQWITSSPSSNSLFQVSQVMGKGFAIEEHFEGYKYDFPTQNIILFATGSGVAPIRSVIESGILGMKDTGRTKRLYYGCRSYEEMAYSDRFESWEELGFEVVPILSQPEDSWGGRTGYVQTALEEDGIPVPRNTGAVLCGVKGMTSAVMDTLKLSGVFEDRMLLNF